MTSTLFRWPGGATMLVRCAVMAGDEEAFRYVGVNEKCTLAHMRDILQVVFSLPEGSPCPGGFSRDPGSGERLDSEAELGEFLTTPGETVYFQWGLWTFQIAQLEEYPRSAAGPSALCVAGDGRFADADFDIAAINGELRRTG